MRVAAALRPAPCRSRARAAPASRARPLAAPLRCCRRTPRLRVFAAVPPPPLPAAMSTRTALISALNELLPPALALGALISAAAGVTWPARVALAVLGLQLARLAVADADLTLLALGAPPARAFAGRAAWVVGASQGIGEALALQLARRGAFVVLSARRADALARVAAACAAEGAAGVAVVPFDLRGGTAAHAQAAAAAAKACASSASSGGSLAYLFLAAGGTQRAAAEETSAEVDTDMFTLNVTSLLSLTKAALPHLKLGARIVVMASAAAKLASPGQAGYAGTKHALAGWFGSLRAELAGRRCHVTLVCPGPVASGAPGQPRVTFGATLAGSHLGAATTNDNHDSAGTTPPADGTADPGDAKARLPLQRCAALTLAAAGHGVREAWLARHPVLLLLYLTQLAPSLGAAIIDRVGPKRVAAARSGGNMYAAR